MFVQIAKMECEPHRPIVHRHNRLRLTPTSTTITMMKDDECFSREDQVAQAIHEHYRHGEEYDIVVSAIPARLLGQGMVWQDGPRPRVITEVTIEKRESGPVVIIETASQICSWIPVWRNLWRIVPSRESSWEFRDPSPDEGGRRVIHFSGKGSFLKNTVRRRGVGGVQTGVSVAARSDAVPKSNFAKSRFCH